jgi:hypothetical protein
LFLFSHSFQISSICIDQSGKVRIWDALQSTHSLKLELQALGGQILDMAWSNDAQRVVAVGEGREK